MTPNSNLERVLDLTVMGVSGRVKIKSPGRAPHFFPSGCSCGRGQWIAGSTVGRYPLCATCTNAYGWESVAGRNLDSPGGRREAKDLLEFQANARVAEPLTATLVVSHFLALSDQFIQQVRDHSITCRRTIMRIENLES